MEICRLSIPVSFGLSFLKIRWSDRVLVEEKKRIIGEGVVYGGDWEKAERLAKQMAKMRFEKERGDLRVCEQVFLSSVQSQESRDKLVGEIQAIRRRRSNLKVKVGRNTFDDIKTLEYIRNALKFSNKIRIDANQGYSLKQLRYLIPTLKQLGIVYVEEPVRVKDLSTASELLHRNGMKIILDESLNVLRTLLPRGGGASFPDVDVINIKLSRIGDIKEALYFIKLAKKYKKKVVIGCSEELERGMKAIYALGQYAKQEGILLEVEGFGPLRLQRLQHQAIAIPRFINKMENFFLVLQHCIAQQLFDMWWSVMRLVVLLIKESKKFSSLSLHLVKWTGKHGQKIHPKHLISKKYHPEYLSYISKKDVVLDVGCGNGQNSLLAAKSAKLVYGFDTDQRQLKIAQLETTQQQIVNVNFSQASAEKKFPFRSSFFDKVMFLGVLEHLYERKLALHEVYRVLKSKGLLFLGIPHEDTSWKILQQRFGIQHFTDPDHKIEYSLGNIQEMLQHHNFNIKKIVTTSFDTPWAGFIDVLGAISLQLYEQLILWKWKEAKQHPGESISFLVIAQKTL